MRERERDVCLRVHTFRHTHTHRDPAYTSRISWDRRVQFEV